MITVQQADILSLVQDFKCLRSWHIERLISEKYKSKPENIEKMLNQLVYMGKIMISNDYVMLCGRKPDRILLDAFDVMLESSKGSAELFYLGSKPFTLMFSVKTPNSLNVENEMYNHYGIIKVEPYLESVICRQIQSVDRDLTVIFILANNEQRSLIKTNHKSYYVIKEDSGYKFFK